jgi:hypothetical protein
MSSLWTPDGERPIASSPTAGERPIASSPKTGERPGSSPSTGDTGPSASGAETQFDPENQADMEELRAQLADTPAGVVVANHCFGLFELAALHLSLQPPQLDQAQTAIDALGALVEALPGRLGDVEPQIVEGLTQLRMAYVQIAKVIHDLPDNVTDPSEN